VTPFLRSARGLEEFDRVAGWIIQQDFRSTRPRDDVISPELKPAQPGDFRR